MSLFREECVIPGAEDRPITFDVSFNPNGRNMPIVVFCHGFKGFKDWGAWNVVANAFALSGMFFVKMNFSHNGVDPENLSDITNAEAFGQNTISKELTDLGNMLDWLTVDNEIYRPYIDAEDISIIGHSRGAATALIKSLEDERIKRVISWAGAFNLKKFAEIENDKAWKERGFTEVVNGRTKQIYKLDYGFRQDFLDNEERMDLTKQLPLLDQPLLLVHGSNDGVSPISNARIIHDHVSHALLIENDGDHVFGAAHPWTEESLPEALALTVKDSLEFVVL